MDQRSIAILAMERQRMLRHEAEADRLARLTGPREAVPRRWERARAFAVARLTGSGPGLRSSLPAEDC
jgi:hypothetical protein